MGSNRSIHTWYCTLLLIAVVSSSLLTYRLSVPSHPDTPVYVVGSVTITDHERLPEYQSIAGPLAAKMGGYAPLAYASPELLEGELPKEALYFIERYDSLAGLQGFIHSPEFEKAKVLRDQVANVHFMIWLPAVDAESLPH